MTFDLTKILESKRAFRQRQAARPIEEKLAMLDALRERTVAVRSAQAATDTERLREKTPPYQVMQIAPG